MTVLAEFVNGVNELVNGDRLPKFDCMWIIKDFSLKSHILQFDLKNIRNKPDKNISELDAGN